MKLTIGLATRNRPKMLMETAMEIMQNVRHENTRLVVLADTDDVPTLECWTFEDPRVILDVRDRPDSVAEKWNRMMEIEPADVYLPAADDAPHKTPGFDAKILEAAAVFPDGIGVVYGHMNNLSFPQLQAFTAKWVEVVGNIYVPHFPYWFTDHWVDDVAKMVGRISACDVLVNDQKPNTQEHRDPALWATLYDALYKDREADAEKLLDATHCEPWRKEMLRSTWHLIHERSRMINNLVRGMEAQVDLPSKWYEPIKKRGEELLTKTFWDLQEEQNMKVLERKAA